MCSYCNVFNVIWCLFVQILKKAIYTAMDGNLQRRYTMQRLHIYPDDNIPEKIKQNITNQIRPLRPVPKRLDHYAPEEVEQFPKVMDWPKDYVIRWLSL